MYVLRIAVWYALLGCGLSFSVPDTVRQDSGNDLDFRDHRLRQLMRAYESRDPQPMPEPPLQNHSSFDHPSHDSSFPPSIRDRMTNERFEDTSLPGAEPVNSYQDFYRFMYGTQEGVNFLRKNYGPNGLQQARANFKVVNEEMEVRLANAHFLRIRSRARCKVPSPQLIRVKDYYPDPSREYLPRCTLLHRCGDTSGCCDSDAFHCVPKAVQEVTLRFYTISVGKYGLSNKRGNSVEKLLFENHTSCQCQPVNDRPRMVQTGHNFLQDGKNDHSFKSKCRDCPVPFTSRIYKDGRCGCDCFDKQRPCLRIKRGRDALSDIERRCVLANHCHIPECAYGQYSPETGTCPKRDDDVHNRRPNHPSHNQRWGYHERD